MQSIVKLEKQITFFLQHEMSQISNELHLQQKEISQFKCEISNLNKKLMK